MANDVTVSRVARPAPSRAVPSRGSAADPLSTRSEQVPLPFAGEMQQAFGQSFDSVQTFAGPQTHAATAERGARALTRGERISLGEARPPREVVAHELAHVVQSRGGSGGGSVGAEGDADRAAAAVLAGKRPQVQARTRPGEVMAWSGHEHRAIGNLAAIYANGGDFALNKDPKHDYQDGGVGFGG